MIKLKMEKEILKHHSDQLDNCEECSPNGGVDMRRERNVYCLGSFWGQFILLLILSLLFWLCLFSIAGYIPTMQNYSATPMQCGPMGQYQNQNPVQSSRNELSPAGANTSNGTGTLNITEPIPASTNFVFFGYIITAMMGTGEDEAIINNRNDALLLDTTETETETIIVDSTISVDPIITTTLQIDTQISSLNETDDVEFPYNKSYSMPLTKGNNNNNNISMLFDLITQSLTETEFPLPKYFISPEDQKLNWFEALQACVLNDMQLVAIQTEEKNREITQLIEDEIGSGEIELWTSGINLWSYSRSKYYWASTGTPLKYTNWHMNNPNSPADQNCVQITNTIDSPTKKSLRWNDYACYTKSRFICENFSD